MRKFLLIGLVAASSAFSAIITVTPTLGPDNLTAPGTTFNDWAVNVIANLRNSAAPDGTGVAQYTPVTTPLTGKEFIITSPSESWQGVAGPVFPGQQGTVLYFSVSIIAQGAETFRLNQLSAQETYLGQLQLPTYAPGDFSGFSVRREGDKFGGGAATSDTDELIALYYVGLGFGQPVDTSGGGTLQQQIDATVAEIQALADRTTTVSYSINLSAGGSATGFASVDVDGIPEPATWALMGAGLAGLGLLRRRAA